MAKALIVEILADAKQFGGELDRAAGKTRSLSKVAGVAGLAIAGGLALGLERSVKSATKFQSSMQLLTTQAGVSEKELGSLKQGVLALAGPTATAPDELAQGMYHLASQGLRGQKALDALKVAAEGAQVGQADLEDVTNALGAAIVSHVKGVKDLNHAMGAMNATVGAGDMRMQDLADAMGTGVLAMAKTAGVGLKDVNAALAVFGDNNIRGAKAGTLVASALRLMSAPSKAAAKALGDAGINSIQLANVLRKQGLPSALEFLQKKMTDAGMSATEQGILISHAFGGKQAGGIRILMTQMERLKQKEEEVGKGADGFKEAWQKTSETTEFKFKQMKAAMESVEVNLGSALLPAVSAVANQIAILTGWLAKHSTVAKVAVGVLGTLAGTLIAISVASSIARAATTLWAAATATATAAQWLLNAALDANPIGLIVIAIAALAAAFVFAWEHSQTFRNIVVGAWTDIKNITLAVVGALTGMVEAVWGAISGIGDKITSMVDTIKGWGSSIGGWIEGAVVGGLVNLATDVWGVVKKIWDKYQAMISTIKGWGTHVGNWVKNALVDGIQGVAEGAWGKVKKIWDRFSGAIATIKNWGSSAGGWIHSAIVGGVAGVADGVWGVVKKIWDKFQAAKDTITGWGSKVGGWIYAGFKAGIDGVIGVIQTLIRWINKALSLVGKLVHAASHIPHGGGGTVSPIGGIPIPVPGFASGGIVTRPTLAVVGEAGPEAIVPLGSGGMGGEVHVHVGPIYGTVDAAFARMLSASLATELRNGGTPQLQQAIQAL